MVTSLVFFVQDAAHLPAEPAAPEILDPAAAAGNENSIEIFPPLDQGVCDY